MEQTTKKNYGNYQVSPDTAHILDIMELLEVVTSGLINVAEELDATPQPDNKWVLDVLNARAAFDSVIFQMLGRTISNNIAEGVATEDGKAKIF